MLYAGIDIGSTGAKAAVLDEDGKIVFQNLQPTGWDSVGTAAKIKGEIEAKFPGEEIRYVATGYGRISVPYAHKTVTEITCHGKGASYLFGAKPCTVIDVGGQDTKIIAIENGQVKDFLMNDKCSAGTGRFLEIMANTLGTTLEGLCAMAPLGSDITISSMCTVFAESEVISLIGKGTSKEDVSFAVVESICTKVSQLASRLVNPNQPVYLTGGLCELEYIIQVLSSKVGRQIESSPQARYAGAIGAALIASK